MDGAMTRTDPTPTDPTPTDPTPTDPTRTDRTRTDPTRTYRTIDVPVAGGDLRVGIWDPVPDGLHALDAPTVLLVHGVTASHLAWQFVADALPHVRLIAPDLRGRGRSNALGGPAGMAAHAEDLAAVCAHLDLPAVLVVGHSMGAFVALAFALRHPDAVTSLLLVDGGLPLAAPTGLDPEELVAAILGPTAERLSMRFADLDAYLDFWRRHPAFRNDWSPELERYLAYDLVPNDGGLRPATSYQTTVDDTVDLNTGSVVHESLAALRHPALLITVPRGLQDEPPGLYPPAHLTGLLERYAGIEHRRYEGFNHYTIVMSEQGASAVALAVAELAASVPAPVVAVAAGAPATVPGSGRSHP